MDLSIPDYSVQTLLLSPINMGSKLMWYILEMMVSESVHWNLSCIIIKQLISNGEQQVFLEKYFYNRRKCFVKNYFIEIIGRT
jgi:hypothetical protein